MSDESSYFPFLKHPTNTLSISLLQVLQELLSVYYKLIHTVQVTSWASDWNSLTRKSTRQIDVVPVQQVILIVC